MNENDTALFISAAKDVSLNSIPHRREDGLFVFCKGQLSILNQAVYQPLRSMISQIKTWIQEKERTQKIIFALKAPLDMENERFQQEIDKLDEKLNEAEFELESKIKTLQDFDDDLAIRGIHLLDQSSTNNGKGNSIISPSHGNWKSLIFSFIFSEILMTGLLWHSMRDFLDIQEIIFRSIGILAIFISIHLAARLKSSHGVAYTYYIGFALVMLLSAIFLNPALSVLFPLNSTSAGLEDIWKHIDNESLASSISIKIPVIVAIYRKFPNVEAVLVLLCFFALRQFVQPIKTKKESLQATNESFKDFYNPHQELRNRRGTLEKEKNNSALKSEQIQNNKVRASQLHSVALSNFLNEVNKYEAAVKKIELNIQETQNQFDLLFNRLLAELESYGIEFRSNIGKDQIKQTLFVNVNWPDKADILNYLKIS